MRSPPPSLRSKVGLNERVGNIVFPKLSNDFHTPVSIFVSSVFVLVYVTEENFRSTIFVFGLTNAM